LLAQDLLGSKHLGQKRFRSGVLWAGEHGPRVPLFNNLPLVHEDQMVADLASKTYLMGNDDHGNAASR
jgi:hypothetical protein